MKNNPRRDEIITALYKWFVTAKGTPVIKDTTALNNTKFDFYVDSAIVNPLSFTVFEMSDNGELVIDEPQRVVESSAAFFVFVNTKTGWISVIKNTTENQKKLIRKEPIQNLKVKIVP